MAITFNGVDQYGHSAESFATNAADEDSTLAFFVRPQTLTATGYPVAVNKDTSDFEFFTARMEPTSDIAGRHKILTDATTTYTALTNDAWTPIVVTYAAATHTVTLYAGSTTGVSASNSDTSTSWDTFTVGAAHGVGATPGDFFKGKVAYAMFFERLWNATEISDFISATSVAAINAIDTTSLKARYDLIADGAADGAGVGLTLVGTPTFDADDPLTAAPVATPGIPSLTLKKDGVALGSLTGIKVQVVAGSELNGTSLYYTATATATAGVMDPIDLSSTAAAVSDPVVVKVLTAEGYGITYTTTVADIS